MAGDLSSFIGQQLVALATHHCQELVDVHAGIDRYLASKVVVELLLLDAFGGVVTQELCQTLNPHGWTRWLGVGWGACEGTAAENSKMRHCQPERERRLSGWRKASWC